MSPIRTCLGASAAIGRGDFAGAIEHLKAQIGAKGENGYDRFMIAYCYEKLGDDGQAVDHATRALAEDCNDFLSLQLLSKCHHRMADFETAYTYICRALEHAPEPPNRPPKIFLRALEGLVRLLWFIRPGSKKRNLDLEESFDRYDRNTAAWLAWAREWKAWYEGYHGKPHEPTRH